MVFTRCVTKVRDGGGMGDAGGAKIGRCECMIFRRCKVIIFLGLHERAKVGRRIAGMVFTRCVSRTAGLELVWTRHGFAGRKLPLNFKPSTYSMRSRIFRCGSD